MTRAQDNTTAQDFWIGLAGVFLALVAVYLIGQLPRESKDNGAAQEHLLIAIESAHRDLRVCQEIAVSLQSKDRISSEYICEPGVTNVAGSYEIAWHDTPSRQFPIYIKNAAPIRMTLRIWLQLSYSKSDSSRPNSALDLASPLDAGREIRISVSTVGTGVRKSVSLERGNGYGAELEMRL